MGANCSRPPPPPLIEISGPRSKILVPAGSAFTFHPPDYRGRGPQIHPYNPYPLRYHQSHPPPSPYTPPPEYKQRPKLNPRSCFPSPGADPRGGGRYERQNTYRGPPVSNRDRGRSPSSASSFTDRDQRGRYRAMNLGRERARRDPRAKLKTFGGRNTESNSSDMNFSEPGSPRGMGGRMRGGGMGGFGGRRGGGIYAQGMGMNSAPDLRAPMGYPGGGHPGMQQPVVHEYVGAGAIPGYGGVPQPGVGGGMGIPGGGLPYVPGGGMGYPNPYQQQQAQQPVPMQCAPPAPLPQQAQERPRVAPLPGHAAVPMGPYAMPSPSLSSPSIPRAHTDPPPAAKLNRGKPADQRAGPQGQEWIQGDPFLDACFCTTQCTCRKGHRMLYREKLDDGQMAQGEIRYLPKDLLGRDCGDHSGCNQIEMERPRSGGEKRKAAERENGERGNEKECRAARVEARQGIQRLNEGLNDIAAKLNEMNLKQRGSGELGNGMGIGAAAVPEQGLASQRMQYPGGQPHLLDPMQQRLAAAGMQGMMDPRAAAMGGRPMGAIEQLGIPPMGMGMNHRMPGYNEDPMAFPNPYGDMYEESERGMGGMMGMGQRPSRGMMNGMPPSYGPPLRRGGKGRRPPRMGMDFDPRGPPMKGGRGGRQVKGGRRPRDFEEDEEHDMGPMKDMSGGRGGLNGEGDESWVDETEEDDGIGPIGRRGSPGGRPSGRRGGRGPSMGRRGLPGSRGRRARVDDEEEGGSNI